MMSADPVAFIVTNPVFDTVATDGSTLVHNDLLVTTSAAPLF
jgi:hypothetical protein